MTGLILGGVFFLVFLIVFNNVSDNPKYAQVNETLAVLFWMVIWWLFEVVDVAATALLPLILFPTLGILSGKVVASKYMSDLEPYLLPHFAYPHP